MTQAQQAQPEFDVFLSYKSEDEAWLRPAVILRRAARR